MQLTCRLPLLVGSISDTDRQALAEMLQSGGRFRCPDTPRDAIPLAIEELLNTSADRRDDELFALWSAARDDVAQCTSDAQKLWFAQAARRLLPREATRALLGFDRWRMLALLGSPPVIDEVQRQQSTGLSDNHLHSGAADEFGELLARLIPRTVEDTEPRGLDKAVGIDVRTIDLNAAPLALAVAASCVLLDGSDEPVSDPEHVLADPSWWRAAKRASQDADQIDASEFAVLRQAVRNASTDQGRAPQLAVLYQALTQITNGVTLTPHKLMAARRGLVALSTLHSLVLVAPHNSTLGTFVNRFRLMRRIRDLFGQDTGRLTSAIRCMYRDSGVTAVELRKSIVPPPTRTISVVGVLAAIEHDIEEHAEAAIDACLSLEIDDLQVRMPLTFTRREPRGHDLAAEPADFVPFRAPVGETLAVADAMVQASSSGRCANFIGAIDVVGDEKKVPNWLYAIAYERMSTAPCCQLEFACHAGEYFEDRAEGLRRIGEVALFKPAVVRRIGHCIALTSRNSSPGGESTNSGVLLESVIWSVLVLSGRPESRLEQAMPPADVPAKLIADLKRVMFRLAGEVFGVSALSVENLREWYTNRFDLGTMARWIPQISEFKPHEAISWPRGISRYALPEPRDLVDAMLAATVYDMPVEVRTTTGNQRVRYEPSARCPSSVSSDSRRLLAHAAGHIIGPVREWIRDNDIVIESCPSSNAALGQFPITHHPIWEFHQDGLPCSVNTDDPALFGSALVEEYVHAGMVAVGDGGNGSQFVTTLAETSRSAGMIQESLCKEDELPIDLYRSLLKKT